MTDSSTRASARFYRAHGLGNDYLVFDEGEDWAVSPASVRRVCDRHVGVGSDGILLLRSGRSAPFDVDGYNPDGSRFERSGNGLRILASHLARTGRIDTDPESVRIGGDLVQVECHGGGRGGPWDISVEMGVARFGPEAVGFDRTCMDGSGRIILHRTDEPAVDAELVSVGNPHAVVFESEVSDERSVVVGEGLGLHPGFRNGTNVQLARISGPREVEIRIWERGVGPTTASGTSSCASAAAAVRRGLVDPGAVRVVMPGGVLDVHVDERFEISLRGAVESICEGVLDPSFLRVLSSPSSSE